MHTYILAEAGFFTYFSGMGYEQEDLVDRVAVQATRSIRISWMGPHDYQAHEGAMALYASQIIA